MTAAAPRCKSTSVKPPVEAPTSSARRPRTSRAKWSSACTSLSPPRETYGIGSPLSRTGASASTRSPGLATAWSPMTTLPARMSACARRARIGEPGVDDALVRALARGPLAHVPVYTSDMKWMGFVGALLAASGCHQAADPCAPPETAGDRAAPPARHTPRWAFEPWISKDISDTDDTYAFVDGFASRDIPVGVVVLDSPWETHYNTFVPNPMRYHDFDQLVGDLHARDIRIVLWITQMVNNYGMDFEMGGDTYDGESPNFEAGQTCNFYVDEGDTYVWWKGTGAGVDFFNAHARSWWHASRTRSSIAASTAGSSTSATATSCRRRSTPPPVRSRSRSTPRPTTTTI